MLEGLLVDLVPYGKLYRDKEYTWRNAEASFWASGGERYIMTRAALEAQFSGWAERRESDPSPGVSFGVQIKDGTPIGYVSINWLQPTHRTAMLGAKIGESAYWGGGYGTDAVLLLLDYTFDFLDVRKAWLMTTSQNVRVHRQMDKLGFTLEGRQRESTFIDGAWADWMAYGMLHEEWPGRAALVTRLGLSARKD
jgi:RimJ/RimL family protein N-acetyltransferase